jgi:predicted O-methyltransferase YrrM
MYEKREYDNTKHPKITNDVGGLLNRGESNYLNQVASRVGQGTYVDLGTFRGASAISIADGIRTAGVDAIVWTFDTFDRRHLSRRFAKDRDDSPRDAVEVAIRERDLDRYIQIHTMKTADAPIQLSIFYNCVQFLFLDADHSYEGTKADWEAWGPYLRADAEVAFHDSNLDGVRRVIDELDGWEQVDEVMTIGVVKRC